MIPRNIYFIIAGALILRVLFFFFMYAHIGEAALFTSDSRGFHQTAINVLNGNGFSLKFEPPFTPEAHFTPLYPLLIAGSLYFSNSVLPLIFIQIILSSLMPLLVWRISGFLSESGRIRIYAAALIAFEPTSIIWSSLLLTEIIAIFFLLLAVFYFLKLVENPRWQDAARAGLFLGLSTLTRPHAQFLFMLAFLYLIFITIFLWGKRMLAGSRYVILPVMGGASGSVPAEGGTLAPTLSESAAGADERAGKITYRGNPAIPFIFAAVFLLVLSPWMLRNYQTFGTFNIATTGLRNLYSSLGSSVLTLNTGQPFHVVKTRLHQEFMDKYHVSERDFKDNPAYGGILAQEGFAILREHPKETIQAASISLFAFLTQDLYTDYLQRFNLIPRFNIDFSPSITLLKEGPLKLAELVKERLGWYALIPISGRIFWIAVNVAWISGLFIAFRRGGMERKIALILAVIILSYALTSIVGGFGDQGRFRYPASAFMFLLASYGCANVTRRQNTQ